MIAAQLGYHIPTEISLGVIAIVLTISIVLSIYIPENKKS
jgi:hypothetical protein